MSNDFTLPPRSVSQYYALCGKLPQYQALCGPWHCHSTKLPSVLRHCHRTTATTPRSPCSCGTASTTVSVVLHHLGHLYSKTAAVGFATAKQTVKVTEREHGEIVLVYSLRYILLMK